MTHETARQRAARHKRDPYRAAQIAPKQPLVSVRCACGHARLMHDVTDFQVTVPRCLNRVCGCTEYVEVVDG